MSTCDCLGSSHCPGRYSSLFLYSRRQMESLSRFNLTTGDTNQIFSSHNFMFTNFTMSHHSSQSGECGRGWSLSLSLPPSLSFPLPPSISHPSSYFRCAQVSTARVFWRLAVCGEGWCGWCLQMLSTQPRCLRRCRRLHY